MFSYSAINFQPGQMQAPISGLHSVLLDEKSTAEKNHPSVRQPDKTKINGNMARIFGCRLAAWRRQPLVKSTPGGKGGLRLGNGKYCTIGASPACQRRCLRFLSALQ
jgi:hypothetical protein